MTDGDLPAANRRFFKLLAMEGPNWPNLRWPGKPHSGPPDYPYLRLGKGRGFASGPLRGTTPRFHVDTRGPAAPSDARAYGHTGWLIASARLAEIFRRLEPGGVETLPIELEFRGGVVLPVGAYLMLDVTRTLPALDFERMGLETYEVEGRRCFRGNLPWTKHLRDDIPVGANLFRDDVAPVFIWASQAVRDACRAARIKGLGFAWPDHPATDVR